MTSVDQHSAHAAGRPRPELSRVRLAAPLGPFDQFFVSICAIALGSAIVAPRVLPWVLPTIVFALGVRAMHGPSWRRIKGRELAVVAALGWCALTSLWALDSHESLLAAGALAGSVGVALYGAEVCDRLPRPVLFGLGEALIKVIAVAAVIMAAEELTGLAGRRWLFARWPDLTPFDPFIARDAAGGLWLPPYMSNRNIGVLALLCVPFAMMLSAVKARRWLRVLGIFGGGALGVAVALSEHQTSKLALLVAPLVFFAVRVGGRLALKGLAMGWVAMTLGIVPLVMALDAMGLGRNTRIQESGQHRIVIWQATAERVFDRPVVGHGFGATRQLSRLQLTQADRGKAVGQTPATSPSLPGAPQFSPSTDAHAHNVYLQVWYELGAVGALLLMSAGLFVLRALAASPERVVPYLAAGWSVIVTIAALSWSLSSHWFHAALALSSVLLVLGARLMAPQGAGLQGASS